MQGLRFEDGRFNAAEFDLPEPDEFTEDRTWCAKADLVPTDRIGGEFSAGVALWQRRGAEGWIALVDDGSRCSPFIEIVGWANYVAFRVLAGQFVLSTYLNDDLMAVLNEAFENTKTNQRREARRRARVAK